MGGFRLDGLGDNTDLDDDNDGVDDTDDAYPNDPTESGTTTEMHRIMQTQMMTPVQLRWSAGRGSTRGMGYWIQRGRR